MVWRWWLHQRVAEKRATPAVRREGCRAHGDLRSFLFSPSQIPREELAERTQNLLIEAETAGPAQRQRILDEVITSHLWLAATLARRFLHRGEDEEDLLQVACTGLVEACRRFDPHQGSFVGFAVPTITGVLKRHFRDHGWMIRPPRPTQELASTIWRQWPTLVQQMGALPRARELAEELGEPIGAVQQARFASRATAPPQSMRRCREGSASVRTRPTRTSTAPKRG